MLHHGFAPVRSPRARCAPSPQYRANSGVAAVGVRIGTTTFAFTGNGKLAVRSATHNLEVPAEAYASSATYGCCVVERAVIAVSRTKWLWAWVVQLPGGVGSVSVVSYPVEVMPQGHQYGVWVSVGDSVPLSSVRGICSGSCPVTHIPRLPTGTRYCDELNHDEHCYPVRIEEVVFLPEELAELEASNRIPAEHTRSCPPPPSTAGGSTPPPPPPRLPPLGCEAPAPSAPPSPLCSDSPLLEQIATL